MLIKRTVLPELIKHLDNEEISLLVGPRQSGKTTLMLQLIEKLKLEEKKYIYLNLDIERDSIHFSSQAKLLEKIRSELGNQTGYVFIDEIQKKDNAGIFLKGIYDMNLPYKLIVTGSGSIELKEKIYESLAGRKRVFNINPLSFEEFVNYKTNYLYQEKLVNFFEVNTSLGLELLNEYLMWGGYPKVVVREEFTEKILALEDIYKSFVEKDMQVLLKIEKSEILTNLLKVVASQNGRLVNFSELSNTLGISLPTVKKYLWYLEETYVLKKSPPFFRNTRKEITKSPIYYFIDLGLRNHLLNIPTFDNISDKGFLFQNFIFNDVESLIGSSVTPIKFWRTKQGAEVDIVIDGQVPFGIEVKYTSGDKIDISRSLRSFGEKFPSAKCFMVGLSAGRQKEIVPFFKIHNLLSPLPTP